ncbi:MAG: sugar phosphate isomerase/epimerase [Acidobacteria bacterium]|nr:sugar phosphate isomerase/epimerase [Acidobacteriota bacterium]
MSPTLNRRHLLAAALGAPLAAAAATPPGGLSREVHRQAGTHIRIGLNAYSFNKALMAGQMTVHDVLDYCAAQSIDGVDLTGYYFPGYPNVPKDDYLYGVKRHAFLNGVTISGTGVRNDFALTDPSSRRGHIQLVKDWVDAAAKMGGSMVRVFSGRELPKGYTPDQVLKWMIPAFEECADYGRQHGVLIGLQHHDDFLKTADETIRVVRAVNSDWFSVILDVGSLRQGDPYAEVEKLLPYASNWQIKEHVWYGTRKAEIDLPRLRQIIDKVGYRGFTPIEALGEGDPKQVVTAFLKKVRQAFA